MKKRCPNCKQTIPSTLARVRLCGKCRKPIELHHKWYFHFTGKAVQMRHRQCKFPEHYLTFDQYAKIYGKHLAKLMYVFLLFASPCLALPDAPIPKVAALPMGYAIVPGPPKPVARVPWYARPETLAAFQLGAVMADYTTTARFSRYTHETDPIIVKLGGKHPGWGTLAPLAVADVGLTYLLARKYPKARWLQIAAIAVHAGAAGHNLTLK